ncbi:MAG: HEPN domain-containing protein [Candidatus Woesearchaeota archaeon]|nr:HEPN domain-containing protein [Candidatus Woesearchaeota archaeon]
MKEYDVRKLLDNQTFTEEKIQECIDEKKLRKQSIDYEEIKGHIRKAENNLRFITENIKLRFLDWAITGCYYASYHAALALIQAKGYTSKNHYATLCVLIKKFYRKELTEEDITLVAKFLDYHDVLFYVESKQKREDATYSTKTRFSEQDVEKLRIQATLFVNKTKDILETLK